MSKNSHMYLNTYDLPYLNTIRKKYRKEIIGFISLENREIVIPKLPLFKIRTPTIVSIDKKYLTPPNKTYTVVFHNHPGAKIHLDYNLTDFSDFMSWHNSYSYICTDVIIAYKTVLVAKVKEKISSDLLVQLENDFLETEDYGSNEYYKKADSAYKKWSGKININDYVERCTYSWDIFIQKFKQNAF